MTKLVRKNLLGITNLSIDANIGFNILSVLKELRSYYATISILTPNDINLYVIL